MSPSTFSESFRMRRSLVKLLEVVNYVYKMLTECIRDTKDLHYKTKNAFGKILKI